jgi:exodeoxyribonuclease V alpha subunit
MQPKYPGDSLPSLTEEEIVEYLSSPLFPGIGKKTALLLVEYFGTKVLNILETEPDLLNEIPSCSAYRIALITKAWEKSKLEPSHRTIALLLGIGTSFKLTLNICDYYGHRALSVLQNNPYQIVEDLDRVGFKIADKLALALGVSPENEVRYLQAAIAVLKEEMSNGHCFLPKQFLVESTMEKLSLPEYQPDLDLVEQVIAFGFKSGIFSGGELSESIYLTSVWATELKVASTIKQRHEEGRSQKSEIRSEKQFQTPYSALITDDCSLITDKALSSKEKINIWLHEWEKDKWKELSLLSKEQRQALLMAANHNISILTGGPGRGKTYILKVLVEWLITQNKRIALASPTGKAANRMQNMTGHEAMTIHRLLQWQGNENKFLYNQNNLLPADWLIVDEFSMVDIFLFNSLLKALPLTCQILLVGDADQLPSIGAGMVLRDLLLSEILPTTYLTTIFRQGIGSAIIDAADQINQGIVPKLNRFNCPDAWNLQGDCSLLEAANPTRALRAIYELVRIMKERDDVDLLSQLIVLSPKKKGSAGVHAINKLLQPIFNPKTPNGQEVVIQEVIYRVGDRVIQLKNRYDTLPPVMNGETGIVISVEPKHKKVTISFSEGATITYSPGQFDQIMHSFAITCHKSQGSEFQYVIMPLLTCHTQMLTRQLLYTTVTRAQAVFIAVGQVEALKLAVMADKPARRYTQLTTLLSLDNDEVAEKLNSLRSLTRKSNSSSQSLVTISKRLQQRAIEVSKGQISAIGSLALKLYEDKYGHRPSKQFEKVGTWTFKTYHYPNDAVELLDRAIDIVLDANLTG